MKTHLHSIDDIERDNNFIAIWERVKGFTMTSIERAYSLYTSVKYLNRRRVPGAFVECGVWRGGSAMAILLSNLSEGITDRSLYLYDTFDGMTPATEVDVSVTGVHGGHYLEGTQKSKNDVIWAFAPLEDVKKNVRSTHYPEGKVFYIQGPVEVTLRQAENTPSLIALLRLDTDWYESTKFELEVLYDRVAPGGCIIIDDYGHWEGAKKAVDEFFADKPVLMHRIDYTGRLIILGM